MVEVVVARQQWLAMQYNTGNTILAGVEPEQQSFTSYYVFPVFQDKNPTLQVSTGNKCTSTGSHINVPKLKAYTK